MTYDKRDYLNGTRKFAEIEANVVPFPHRKCVQMELGV